MSNPRTTRTLYGFWASPYLSFAAQMMLEANLEFDYVRVSPFNGGAFGDEHRARNPLCKIPSLLESNGVTISESQAICRYLAKMYPDAKKLYPFDEAVECAKVDTLCDFIDFTISGPMFNWLVISGYFPKAFRLKCEEEASIFSRFSMLRVKDGLDRVSSTAELSPYLLGNRPLMPDFQLFQLLRSGKVFARIFDMPALDLASGDEKMASFYNTMETRESTQLLSKRQDTELPETEKEIFEQFAGVVGPGIRDGIGALLGHPV